MRFFDQGRHFRVTISSDEVDLFADRWPCFGPRRAMAFVFDARNGDLVDIRGDSPRHDGCGVDALVSDARDYGKQRLAKLNRPSA